MSYTRLKCRSLPCLPPPPPPLPFALLLYYDNYCYAYSGFGTWMPTTLIRIDLPSALPMRFLEASASAGAQECKSARVRGCKSACDREKDRQCGAKVKSILGSYQMPPTAHRLPRTAHRAPSTAQYAPRTAHRTPHTVHRAPHTVHRALATTHHASRTTHCAPHIDHTSPLPTILSTLPHTHPASLHPNPTYLVSAKTTRASFSLAVWMMSWEPASEPVKQ